MKKIVFTLLIIANLSLFANENKATVFRVIDDNEELIVGAKITIEGEKDLTLYTNLEGIFEVPEEVGDNYSLKVEFISYKDCEILVNEKERFSHTIELQSK